MSDDNADPPASNDNGDDTGAAAAAGDAKEETAEGEGAPATGGKRRKSSGGGKGAAAASSSSSARPTTAAGVRNIDQISLQSAQFPWLRVVRTSELAAQLRDKSPSNLTQLEQLAKPRGGRTEKWKEPAEAPVRRGADIPVPKNEAALLALATAKNKVAKWTEPPAPVMNARNLPAVEGKSAEHLATLSKPSRSRPKFVYDEPGLLPKAGGKAKGKQATPAAAPAKAPAKTKAPKTEAAAPAAAAAEADEPAEAAQ